MSSLQARFERLWDHADRTAVWRLLDEHYGDTGRAYHNWRHIEAMLQGLDEVRHDAAMTDIRFDELELAIFFHDVVYEPGTPDNEARSAEMFRQQGGSEVLGREAVGRITDMILATKQHDPTSDPATGLLIDLDLAVLGGTAEQYETYAAAIRKEFAFVPEPAWRAGRAAVLRTFLQRHRIYQTEPFATRELAARRNLQREIERLAMAT